MNDIYESTHYDLSLRGILMDDTFKVYTANDAIQVTSDVNFDIQGDAKSSLNYFASSIMGGIAHTIINEGKRAHLEIEELEGKIHLTLAEPLTILGVKGYHEPPSIKTCHITYYVYADTDNDSLIFFCNEALKKSYIYHTLQQAMELTIQFTPLV
ncbi:OsmC family protein [Veillonella sp. 3310]|jgi:hypothetical protein|uniref:OsmC family protein n=1 Tax=Veillonella sp. 3310 TaxID=2490956 RepID=UPI000FD637A5|nr:OsmC family protein [Veillonella sp. 3310]